MLQQFYFLFRKIFSKFGAILDVNVKHSNVNNTVFAFVTFENVDIAMGAKKEVAGQFFGRLQVICLAETRRRLASLDKSVLLDALTFCPLQDEAWPWSALLRRRLGALSAPPASFHRKFCASLKLSIRAWLFGMWTNIVYHLYNVTAIAWIQFT